ncbi:T9SS type A sorting domain-containing protein [Oceanihabitans sp.]|nr:T9SS type A sorting domain-containing protein [Oceanihabitans sp.]
MKKITLLLAISFAFQFNLQAQCPGGTPEVGYTCIPDANFEQILFDLGIDSVNGDNRILNTEAEATTAFLNLTFNPTATPPVLDIANFAGLEAFLNLTDLKISGHSVTTLDVSSNVALTDLNISSSLFSSINLLSNANLTLLNASYSPNLVGLDLTGNPLLTVLNTEECNLLSTLDITGLTGLVNVNLFGNNLSALDVSANLALETLIVRLNALTTLDLSNNVELVALNARNNLLVSLDMRNGNNANVTSFNSDFNGSLTCIFVDNTAEPNLATWSIDGNSTFVANEGECSTLSVDTVNQNVFNMYPNPVMNTVFVNANTQNSQISIYDITGKVVLTKSLILGENTIDVSQMASGVYLARFAAEGNVQTKKLIVQ